MIIMHLEEAAHLSEQEEYGMLKCGIVGLPLCGKSTVFNLITIIKVRGNLFGLLYNMGDEFSVFDLTVNFVSDLITLFIRG